MQMGVNENSLKTIKFQMLHHNFRYAWLDKNLQLVGLPNSKFDTPVKINNIRINIMVLHDVKPLQVSP